MQKNEQPDLSLARLQIAGDDIDLFLKSHPKVAFRFSDLSKILEENKKEWRLTCTKWEFIHYLLGTGKMTEHIFKFPNQKETRYLWGHATDFEIIQSLNTIGYYSHFSAVYLHGLTQQKPATVYFNVEQTKKPSSTAKLAQDRIDLAFNRPCRVSNNIAEFHDYRVCLLSGMNTDLSGISEVSGEWGRDIKVTDIERTLVDIVVRPIYAGGVHSVLEAYRSAVGKVSINRLVAMLSKLGYVYPYHQAIGFCMERAGGYSNVQLSLLDRFPMEFDFYLTHDMGKTDYSERWRLHYPKGL